MQANPEHQQNDPDFGQLRCQLGVRYKAWGKWSDRDPGEKIAYQRREAQPARAPPVSQRQRSRCGRGRAGAVSCALASIARTRSRSAGVAVK